MTAASLLLIRADADAEIGIGHVTRCIALAEAWRDRGGTVRFLTGGDPGIVERRGFAADSIASSEGSELEALRSAAGALEPQWVLLDGYGFDAVHHRTLRNDGWRVAAMDDTAHLPRYDASLVINQNVGADRLPYAARPETKFLLGPAYALLRPEFLRRSEAERRIPARTAKVLVTLGGADAANVTGRVVDALAGIRQEELEVLVVTGPANRWRDDIQRGVGRAGSRFTVLDSPDDMAAVMAWADIGVTAAESTVLETAFMGLPSVVIVLADNQLGIAEGVATHGSAINLGWHDDIAGEAIADAVVALAGDEDRRRTMSSAGRQLVDGAGAQRVVDAMLALAGE